MHGRSVKDTDAFSATDFLCELDIRSFYASGNPQPEKRLMFAVLLEAVDCFKKHAGNEANRLYKDTEEWLLDDNHEWPFSFINICEAVEINPQYLRKGLWNLKQRAVPVSQPSIAASAHAKTQESRKEIRPIPFAHAAKKAFRAYRAAG